VTFQWIHQHRAELDVALACRVLGVSRAGYYAWARRPTCGRASRRRDLTARIRAAHASSRNTYGSPRVTAELKDAGVARCCTTATAACSTRAGGTGRCSTRAGSRAA